MFSGTKSKALGSGFVRRTLLSQFRKQPLLFANLIALQSQRLYSETPQESTLDAPKPTYQPQRQPKSSPNVFDIRKDLENIEVLELDDIIKLSSQRMLKHYRQPDQDVCKKIGAVKTNDDKSVSVNSYTYLFTTPSVGDLVLLEASYDFGSSLTSELAVIVRTPLYEDDELFLFLTNKGTVIEAPGTKMRFRIGRVFSKKFIEDSLVIRDLDPAQEQLNKASRNRNPELDKYFVPESARKIILQKVKLVESQSWLRLPSYLPKLEVISRLLQVNGIQAISILDLEAIVKCFKFQVFRDVVLSRGKTEGVVGSRLEAFQVIEDLFGPQMSFSIDHDKVNVGLSPTKQKSDKTFSASALLSLYMCLKKQNDLWFLKSSSISSGIKSPLAVQVKSLTKLLVSPEELNSKADLDPIISYINQQLESGDVSASFSKPLHYDKILEMLKEYCAGNIINNEQESVVLNILRKITIFENLEKVNRSAAFYLLQKLNYLSPEQRQQLIYQNPNMWSHNYKIPFLDTNRSATADIEQEFIDGLTEESIRLDNNNGESEDPLAKVRHDFQELPVYCIDAETAHEIDDGLSIERLQDDRWMVHVHIANPASYFKPNSKIANIAFKRSTTVYLTETVIPMLPQIVSEISGLGVDDKPTRTITYSFAFNPKTQKVDHLSRTIRAGIVRKFPKVTYNAVDNILSTNQTSFPYYQDLKDLLHVSKSLKQARLDRGALDINFGKVELQKDATGKLLLSKAESMDSQLLVSELMIEANSISGDIFTEHSISGFFRNLPEVVGYKESKSFLEGQRPRQNKTRNENKLPDTEKKTIFEKYSELQRRSAAGEPVTFSELMGLVAFLQRSYHSPHSKHHAMLRCKNYNPSTSPLRRYGDLVNQWQVHAFLMGKKVLPFSYEHIMAQVVHYQHQQEMAKLAQKESVTYWKVQLLIDLLNKSDRSRASGDSGEGSGGTQFDKFLNINYASSENHFKLLVRNVDEQSVNTRHGIGSLLNFQVNAFFRTDNVERVPEVNEEIAVRVYHINPVEGEIYVDIIEE